MSPLNIFCFYGTACYVIKRTEILWLILKMLIYVILYLFELVLEYLIKVYITIQMSTESMCRDELDAFIGMAP